VEDRTNYDKRWDKLNQKIKQVEPTYNEPDLPFKQSTLIRDYNELYSKIYDKEKYINL
jgi:hypothetical protein